MNTVTKIIVWVLVVLLLLGAAGVVAYYVLKDEGVSFYVEYNGERYYSSASEADLFFKTGGCSPTLNFFFIAVARYRSSKISSVVTSDRRSRLPCEILYLGVYLLISIKSFSLSLRSALSASGAASAYARNGAGAAAYFRFV